MPKPDNNKLPGHPAFSDFHAPLMHAPIGVYTSTLEGRFLSVNPALARMLGYASPEELIESITDIASQVYTEPSDREEFIRLMEKNGEVVNLELQFQKKDGSTIWTSINAWGVRDINGKITHCQGFITDITRRKLAEESLRKQEYFYRNILSSMDDAVFLTDEKGFLTFICPNAFTTFGRSEQELLEMEILSVFWARVCLKPENSPQNMKKSATGNVKSRTQMDVFAIFWSISNAFLLKFRKKGSTCTAVGMLPKKSKVKIYFGRPWKDTD